MNPSDKISLANTVILLKEQLKRSESRIQDLENFMYDVIAELQKLHPCDTCMDIPNDYEKMNAIHTYSQCPKCQLKELDDDMVYDLTKEDYDI